MHSLGGFQSCGYKVGFTEEFLKSEDAVMARCEDDVMNEDDVLNRVPALELEEINEAHGRLARSYTSTGKKEKKRELLKHFFIRKAET